MSRSFELLSKLGITEDLVVSWKTGKLDKWYVALPNTYPQLGKFVREREMEDGSYAVYYANVLMRMIVDHDAQTGRVTHYLYHGANSTTNIAINTRYNPPTALNVNMKPIPPTIKSTKQLMVLIDKDKSELDKARQSVADKQKEKQDAEMKKRADALASADSDRDICKTIYPELAKLFDKPHAVSGFDGFALNYGTFLNVGFKVPVQNRNFERSFSENSGMIDAAERQMSKMLAPYLDMFDFTYAPLSHSAARDQQRQYNNADQDDDDAWYDELYMKSTIALKPKAKK